MPVHVTGPPPFVAATDLSGLQPVLVDVRWYLDGRSGRDAYLSGHLPGAVFVDLDRHLAGPGAPTEGRHPLPSPARFAGGLAEAGIDDDDTVVAYDDAGGTVAARLVWLLRATGRRAAVLDGGLQAWPGPLETGEVHRPRTSPQVRPWPQDLLASTAEVADLGAGGRPVLLDARAPARYRGESEPVDPRAGHVPGARNLPATDALDDDGRLRPVEQLRAAMTAVGAGPGTPVVASCGSGVTACFTLLVREQAGLPPGRLWPASFSGWSRDPDRTVVTGAAPH
ncbi:sulfurtransferase [Aquipuribacter nitratireducens]|uniref:Sulfurtransferase n=1 Tax=Aquipuribacter nitratireducens TaxID=650104 RepID=A0ABW0GJT5_9MICO